MENHEYFMKKAIEQATLGMQLGNYAIGCVIVLKNKIISQAFATRMSNDNRVEHAEMNAILKIGNLLAKNKNQAILYTTCEPCPMCFSTIFVNKFKKLVYGMSDSSGATHLINKMPVYYNKKDYSLDIVNGVLEKECLEVYKESLKKIKK